MSRKVNRRVTKVARIASTSAKTKMVMKAPKGLTTAQCVPRAKLQSVMAKYRMAMAKLNSERHQAKVLNCKICDLQCKIQELEQKLAAGPTTPT